MAKTPISTEKETGGGNGCLVLFGFVFASFGMVFIYFMFIGPWLKSREAQSWHKTPCVIISSKIKTHFDSDGDTYSPDIQYQYFIDEEAREGNQFSFTNWSGPRSSAKAIVDKYPQGLKTKCYYNPNDPSEVVLDRNNSDVSYWFLAIPVVFVLVGVGIMFSGIFTRFSNSKPSISGAMDAAEARHTNSLFMSERTLPQSSSNNPQTLLEADKQDQEWLAPRKLKTNSSKLVAFIFISVFALFWNGVTGTGFFSSVLRIFDDGFNIGSIFFCLFMIPFVLVGVLLICGSVYLFLSLFTPNVEIAISSGAVAPGQEVDIAWEIDGKVERVKKLKIQIHGTQSVTYVRGTDTVTDTEVFEVVEVIEVTDTLDIAFGSATVQIPAETMHTFEAKNNKFLWTVNVHGEIPWSPDINESFPFRVTPQLSSS